MNQSKKGEVPKEKSISDPSTDPKEYVQHFKRQDRRVVKSYSIQVEDIPILVEEKRIQNIHISVNPPVGAVKISAPLKTKTEDLKLAVMEKLSWIKEQQEDLQNQKRISKREMLSGESHYFRGKRYLLAVHYFTGKPYVQIRNKRYIDLFVPEGSTKLKRERLLEGWYKKELEQSLVAVTPKWESIIGARADEYRVRKLKTRWGSCDHQKKIITVNIELIKKRQECLEYILAHELIHIIEPSHNDNFRRLMDKHVPRWESLKELLNKDPLRHENWKY